MFVLAAVLLISLIGGGLGTRKPSMNWSFYYYYGCAGAFEGNGGGAIEPLIAEGGPMLPRPLFMG